MELDTALYLLPRTFILIVILHFISGFLTWALLESPGIAAKTIFLLKACTIPCYGIMLYVLALIGWSFIAFNFPKYIPWLAGV